MKASTNKVQFSSVIVCSIKPICPEEENERGYGSYQQSQEVPLPSSQSANYRHQSNPLTNVIEILCCVFSLAWLQRLYSLLLLFIKARQHFIRFLALELLQTSQSRP